MIRVENVTKVFNPGRPSEYTALRGVSVVTLENKVTVLRGPSGSGKTTLLSLMGCMTRPTSGRIYLGERNISSLPERFLSELRRTAFGFIFQSFNLIAGLTALENVMVPSYPLGQPRGQVRERAAALLEKFRLGSKIDQKIENLSGGEKQRTAIARALINDPATIIADEPTANLDTALSLEFLDIVGQLRAEGKTFVIASHDALVHEAAVVDEVVSLRDGLVVPTDRHAA
ncbi:ABC transporter ATP-binding protein [Desulfovibrio sp. TomC]|uniref:ABC transporter ATP-binding protein n=1 Tax=Desulfovibrio sp. TomC TaxID=1562888 RepID=UPI000573C0FA|nr:ABC transporter ATP-binding protein [Desulfovibrio sp. TomC]KHK03948.1 ABC-type antimicrobial peptide transport system, ATPase component [Desulfovibrio sp. TomC]